MNKRLTTWIGTLLLIGATGSALADNDYRSARNDRAMYDHAKVISSQPIINYVTVKTPVRECWEEMQYYTVDRRSRYGGGGTLFGAILGGVIGHQVGSGRGNDAATVAGTLIGAAIGSESSRKQNAGYGEERVARPVERCETRFQSRQEERIDGYRVTYRYHGQKYSTVMPYDPGNKIRVRVDVRPAG
ncbi:MAG: glycine zipper 2TM domain-containing protein [Woeseiaceae bacterium]